MCIQLWQVAQEGGGSGGTGNTPGSGGAGTANQGYAGGDGFRYHPSCVHLGTNAFLSALPLGRAQVAALAVLVVVVMAETVFNLQ